MHMLKTKGPSGCGASDSSELTLDKYQYFLYNLTYFCNPRQEATVGPGYAPFLPTVNASIVYLRWRPLGLQTLDSHKVQSELTSTMLSSTWQTEWAYNHMSHSFGKQVQNRPRLSHKATLTDCRRMITSVIHLTEPQKIQLVGLCKTWIFLKFFRSRYYQRAESPWTKIFPTFSVCR